VLLKRKRKAISYLSRKSAEESEPKMTKGECEILVEKIAQKFAHSKVRPPSVD
jgi:hypothetical protein